MRSKRVLLNKSPAFQNFLIFSVSWFLVCACNVLCVVCRRSNGKKRTEEKKARRIKKKRRRKLVPSKWVETREPTRLTTGLSRVRLEKNAKFFMQANFDPAH
ncbi:hypothetical protein VIGAN_03007200 [Vigna angularis var. angularis]|uniref:Uncharacterized protein n=1 Tax=Vigna angularis var. angularis TaxID=157739 RepID=A0A0S3RIN1_PHAAN|nr:hypothetical protein VIGAN_03007200 [Vigna angularis var. angularis]